MAAILSRPQWVNFSMMDGWWKAGILPFFCWVDKNGRYSSITELMEWNICMPLSGINGICIKSYVLLDILLFCFSCIIYSFALWLVTTANVAYWKNDMDVVCGKCGITQNHINEFEWDWCTSTFNALEIQQSCLKPSYCWLYGKLWYLQHNCVGDTIVYHWARELWHKLYGKVSWLAQTAKQS